MQKVLRRTALAKAQAARRDLVRTEKNNAARARLRQQEQQLLNKMVNRDIREERVARREKRELGPLAPRRDVGDRRDTYGAMDPRRLRGVIKLKEEQKPAQLIVAGDRVVLLEGRDKGKIGVVSSVDKERHECVVKGLNLVRPGSAKSRTEFCLRVTDSEQVDIAIPKWMNGQEGEAPPTRTIEAAVPLPSVRLIHTLTDPITGQKRDVIVQKMIVRNVLIDRHLHIKQRARIIPGLDIEIPWPPEEEKEEEEHEVDTLRLDVEAKTWVPTLITPPMPTSVIDELRNKYSKFRDRHDEAYIAKKIAEDEEAKAKKMRLAKSMTTPLQELKRKERGERKAKGKGKLTEEMLSRIGEVMAKKQGLPQKKQSVPASS